MKYVSEGFVGNLNIKRLESSLKSTNKDIASFEPGIKKACSKDPNGNQCKELKGALYGLQQHRVKLKSQLAQAKMKASGNYNKKPGRNV